MKTTTNILENDVNELREDIRHLLRVTADVADEAVVEARRRLSVSYGSATDILERKAKQAKGYVDRHACETAAVALVSGVALGYFLPRLNHH